MTSPLSILCVTRAEEYSLPFLDDMADLAEDCGAELVLVADGDNASRRLEVDTMVRSQGYIESVLDEAIGHCTRPYVLRLDDDERVSYAMYVWLLERHYEADDHWAFPRAHLYPTSDTYVSSPPLWPDLQTRLSVKLKAGGRTTIHAGSPFGTGTVAPCVIEHHKFLVRPVEERRATVARYERLSPGAGHGFAVFSVPEDFPLLETDRCDRVAA